MFQYDEHRLIELLIIAFSFIYGYFKSNLNFSLKNFLILILILISILIQDFNIYEYQDLVMLIGLIVMPFSLSINFKNNKNVQIVFHALYLLIICALIPTLFIVFSVRDLFRDDIWYGWQMNSGSIRIYDSSIVPIIFLSIYLRISEYKYIRKSYLIIVFLFFLGLWFDGARAAILSIFIGISILFIGCKKEHRRVIVSTVSIISLSFVVYSFIYYLYNKNNDGVENSLSVIRSSSSGRWEIWLSVYQRWVEQPLIGVGGNFLATTDYHLNHLHNFYLRLIFEWGFLGAFLLI